MLLGSRWYCKVLGCVARRQVVLQGGRLCYKVVGCVARW